MPIFGTSESGRGANRALTVVSRKRHVRELYNPDQIGAVLRRERARSDRQHCGFSIVLFRLDVNPFRERPLIRLATVLLRLIRETDELGRYDQQTLCAVLPDTDPVGASILIARVRRATAGKGYEPICSIYTYPDPEDPTRPNSRDRGDASLGSDSRGVSSESNTANGERHLEGSNGTHDGHDNHAERRHLVGVMRQGGGIDVAVGSLSESLPAVTLVEEPQLALASEVEVIPAHSMSELFAEPLPVWKRALDIAVASAAILAASPFMIAAAIGIKLSSPGPVIFKQTRTGLGGEPFKIYKFRTMCIDAEKKQAALKALSEQDGPAFKLKNDPRIFPLGRLLRKTSIDELPQLFNVLKGDMTLVGPRPLPVHEAEACIQWQQRRHDVTPGLTCTWQVEGRSRVKFEEWMRMDMRYARKRNLLGDLSLVAKTVPAVLMRRGAN